MKIKKFISLIMTFIFICGVFAPGIVSIADGSANNPTDDNTVIQTIVKFDIQNDEETNAQLPLFVLSPKKDTPYEEIGFPQTLRVLINESEEWVSIPVEKWIKVEASSFEKDSYFEYSPVIDNSVYSIQEGIEIPYGLICFTSEDESELFENDPEDRIDQAEGEDEPAIEGGNEGEVIDSNNNGEENIDENNNGDDNMQAEESQDSNEEAAIDAEENLAPEAEETHVPSNSNSRGNTNPVKANSYTTLNKTIGLPSSYYANPQDGVGIVTGYYNVADRIVWVPRDYDASKKYNVVVLIHGGSSGSSPNDWMRVGWNFSNYNGPSSYKAITLFDKLVSSGRFPRTIFVSIKNEGTASSILQHLKIIIRDFPTYATYSSDDAVLLQNIKSQACHFMLAGASSGADAIETFMEKYNGVINNYLMMSFGDYETSNININNLTAATNTYGKAKNVIIAAGQNEEASTGNSLKHLQALAPYAQNATYIEFTNGNHEWPVWFSALYQSADLICLHDPTGTVTLYKVPTNTTATNWDTGWTTVGNENFYSLRGAEYQIQKKINGNYPTSVVSGSLDDGGTIVAITGKEVNKNGAVVNGNLSDPRKAIISGLSAGTYHYREVTASKGFNVTSTTGWQEIVVVENATTYHSGGNGTNSGNNKYNLARLQEPYKTGSLKITKRSGNTTITGNTNGNGNFSLQGAKYVIHHSNISDANLAKLVYGSSTTKTVVELTTISSGVATITSLPFGNYTIEETYAPAGYLSANKTGSFTISSTTQVNYTAADLMADSPNAINFKIKKANANSEFGTPDMSGAVYTFYKITSKTDTAYTSEKAVGTITTNASGDGLSSITLMCGNWYAMKETVAPAGYDASTTVFKFQLSSAWNSSTNKWVFTVEFYNGTIKTYNDGSNIVTISNTWTAALREPPKRGNAEIHKVDASTGDGLQGAVYGIYTNSACTTIATGETANNVDGTKQAKLMTGADGSAAYVGLAPGTYYLKEMQPPAGYQVNPSVFTFTVTARQTISMYGGAGTNGTYSFYNVSALKDDAIVTSGSVVIVKNNVNNPGSNTPSLAGAIYAIRNTSTNVTTNFPATNANGYSHIDAVEPGVYELVEISAPEGFILNTETSTFTVAANQKTVIVGSSLSSGDAYDLFDSYADDPSTDQLVQATVLDEQEKLSFNIYVQKIAADTNQPLSGASLQIMLGNSILESWTTDGTPHQIMHPLTPGTQYVLHETAATGFYNTAADIYFSVNANGELIVGGVVQANNTIVMTDPRASHQWPIALIKINGSAEYNNNASLTGAVYSIYDADTNTFVKTVTMTNVSPNDSNYDWPFSPSFNDDMAAGSFSLWIADNPDLDIPFTGTENYGYVETTLAPGNYYITETTAPTGYALNLGSINFTILNLSGTAASGTSYCLIGVEGSGSGQNSVSPTPETKGNTRGGTGYQIVGIGIPVLLDSASTGSVTIYKTDASGVSNLSLAGAVYRLTNTSTNVTINMPATNANGMSTLSNLAPGTYSIKEITAPAGFSVSPESVSFTIQAGKDTVLTYNGLAPSGVTLASYQILDDAICLAEQVAHYYIDKRAADMDNASQSGAVLQIKQGNTVIEQWTSNGTPHEIQALLQHNVTYTLHEVSAPTGYYEADDINFYIGDDGKMYDGVAGGSGGYVGTTIYMDNYPLNDVVIIKQSSVAGDTRSMADAQFAIYNADTNALVTTVTTVAGPYQNLPNEIDITGTYGYATFSLKPGNYYMVETVAPAGFQRATNRVDFTIHQQLPAGITSSNIMNYDWYISWFGTLDNTVSHGNGGEKYYTCYQRPFFIVSGTTTGMIVDDDYSFGLVDVQSIKPGEQVRGGSSYDIYYRFAYGMTTPFLSEEPVTDAYIEKLTGGGQALAGAVLQIKQSNTVIEQWTSTASAHKISATLTPGTTYTLHEVSAPAGYGLALDINFTVDAAGNVLIGGQTQSNNSVKMYDYKSATMPGSGSEDAIVLSCIGAVILLAGIAIMIIPRRRKRTQTD